MGVHDYFGIIDDGRIHSCTAYNPEGYCADLISDYGQVRHTVGPASWTMTIVPIPTAVWLFGSGLIGLIGIARRKKS